MSNLMEQTHTQLLSCSASRGRDLFRQVGVLLLFLHPYSPHLTPIELLFSKVKCYLKQHGDIVNAIPDPEGVITAAFNSITKEDRTVWATHCGYGQ